MPLLPVLTVTTASSHYTPVKVPNFSLSSSPAISSMENETSKRQRDEEADESRAVSPEAKRLRADILDILDDDADNPGGGAVQDLASVMRSLEEEIAVPPPKTDTCPSDLVEATDDFRGSDLGYLLEASDDELGLPPTAPSSSEGELEAEPAEVAGEEVEGVGFGQIWGFEDEIAVCYEGLEFGIRPESSVVDDVGGFDGGLFDYPDVAFEPSDFGDLSWRSESMPAV